VLAYGYRYGEVPLAPLTAIKESARITKPREVDLSIRPPVAVSLGCHIQGAAAPHPDPHDPNTMAAGVAKRFAIKPPTPETELVTQLTEFVQLWLSQNLTPLEATTDLTVPTWLEGTAYPSWRRDDLLQTWETETCTWRTYVCKSHQKDETYAEFKHARGINARSDLFKCMVGPTFKAIESKLYQHPSFIKHVPVDKRAAYISEMLKSPGSKYYATDYTAFESLFVKTLMQACEFELYSYMTKFLPTHGWFMGICDKVLAGVNHCYFKHFRVELEATRMSGEMCTSLGNGFSNLMFMLFMAKQKGCTDVKGVVEGDDGLFTMNGDPPTSEDFARLGLIIKMETHLHLSTASFCGIVFDEDDLLNITDPRTVLVNFGWGSRIYAGSHNKKILSALLRCKALSLAYSYPGCPILGALAKMALRVTEGITNRDIVHLVVNRRQAMNDWQREWTLALMKKHPVFQDPPLNTRFLMEKLYGILVEDQIAIEKHFDSINELGPINFGLIDLYMRDCWLHYARSYVQVAPEDMFRPTLPIARMAGFKDELEALCGWKPQSF
jgi:hypothetical protein